MKTTKEQLTPAHDPAQDEAAKLQQTIDAANHLPPTPATIEAVQAAPLSVTPGEDYKG